jgi:pSer/pThr/pTyr-binding forkhead associated (FHA) protein
MGNAVNLETNEVNPAITASVKVVRRDRQTRRHSLEQFEGDGAPRQFVIDREQMVVGRDAAADIRLLSKRASRQHALLRVRGTDCVIVDNESHNGVLLNGGKIHSAVLRDGDVVQMADSGFIYHGD